MQHIVVGVDGSPSSRRALSWAVDYARRTATTVEAVIAWQSQPVYDYGYGWAPIVVTGGGAAEAAGALLGKSISDVLGDDRHTVQIRPWVLQGRPTDVLLSIARTADMLIVGSRGHGTVAGMLLNSVSQHCVQHAPCPVLVVPAPAARPPLDILAPRRPRRRPIAVHLASRIFGGDDHRSHHDGRREP